MNPALKLGLRMGRAFKWALPLPPIGFFWDRCTSHDPYIDHGHRNKYEIYESLTLFPVVGVLALFLLPGISVSETYDKWRYPERWDPKWKSRAQIIHDKMMEDSDGDYTSYRRDYSRITYF
jgi:hypothetical protein